METGEITERLGKISESFNGLIGRLSLLRNLKPPIGRESHDLAISIGNQINDLINDIDLET